MNYFSPPWTVKGHCLEAIAEPSPAPMCQDASVCPPALSWRGGITSSTTIAFPACSSPTPLLCSPDLLELGLLHTSPEPLTAGSHSPAWLHHGVPAEVPAGIPRRSSHPPDQHSSADRRAWAQPPHATSSMAAALSRSGVLLSSLNPPLPSRNIFIHAPPVANPVPSPCFERSSDRLLLLGTSSL